MGNRILEKLLNKKFKSLVCQLSISLTMIFSTHALATSSNMPPALSIDSDTIKVAKDGILTLMGFTVLPDVTTSSF